MSQIEQKLEQIQGDVAIIKEILLGNGEPSKGLVVRIDRLETAETRRHWFTTTALAASITAFIGLVIKFFTSHH